MTRQIFILLAVVLGFFLTPTPTYACGGTAGKTEKSCCAKGTSKTDKKDCSQQEHSKKSDTNDGCGGQCENPSCHCPAFSFNSILPFFPELNHNAYFAKIQSIPYTETYASSGFLSIWLPPKIS